jgi:hypothetical protein
MEEILYCTSNCGDHNVYTSTTRSILDCDLDTTFSEHYIRTDQNDG